jgi:rhamnulose-1-phosphate aldolase
MKLSPELQKVIDDIAEASGYVWEKGWAARNAGNLSVDVTDLMKGKPDQSPVVPINLPLGITLPGLAGRYFIVKINGFRFRDLARKPEKGLLLVQVTEKADGYHYLWGGEGPGSKPTAEFIPHLKIQSFLLRNKRPEKAVLHTHPPHLIALSHLEDYGQDSFNCFLWATHVGAKLFLPEGIGMVPFLRGGSEELADATAALFAKHRAVLWEKHGCTTIGSDVMDAFDVIDMLNTTAKDHLICKSAGFAPKCLTDVQLAELKKLAI